MKYYLLIIILLYNFSLLPGQEPDTLNRKDDAGRMTGYWIKYHPNGGKKYEGYFHKGEPTGILRRYYPDGMIQSVSDYAHSGDTVRVVMYYENGRKAAEGKFANRKKTGKWYYYSFWNDDYKVMEEHYLNNRKNGPAYKYHKNGKLAEIIEWKNGHKQGEWKQFYQTGVLSLKAHYVQDKLHGDYLVNHLDGKRNVTGKYVHDLKHGTWHFYNEEGEERKIHYIHGVAENQEELDSLHQKLLNDLEKNKGRIKDPAKGEIEW